MADTVTFQSATPATPPDATIIATDDAGASGHVQVVKLAISTDGSATPIPADATNGIDVDVTRVGGNVTVIDGGGSLSVDDGAGSLTVDNAALAVVGGGVEAAALRVTIANDSTGVLSVDDNGGALTVDGTVTVQDGGGALSVDDNGGSLTVDNAALAVVGGGVEAAALRVTIANDSTGVLSVDDNGGALTVDNAGTFAVQPGPATSGGLSIFRSLDLDETEEEVKASAGQVYGWYIVNRATSPRYVKFYNATAANVTVGTTTPVITLEIPGNSTDHIAANVLGGMGIAFDTAISVAATTGLADNDTGAPAANDVVVNIFYK